MHLRCVDCGREHPAAMLYACAACGGILEVAEACGTSIEGDAYLEASMWRHARRLPVQTTSAIISLGEGMTPLHRARRLEKLVGFAGEIWIKDETVSPTGSFKDRLVSAAISRARELGLNEIVCASSGNAGASASAYAARAGIPAVVVVPTHTPDEKLTQIAAYGALLVKVDGHYSKSYVVAQELSRQHGLVNVTTTFLNPYGVDALKIVGQEIADQLADQVPDYVLVPTGAGPLVKGIVQGFRESSAHRTPKLVAVQAEGCAPIVRAFDSGAVAVEAWGMPTTIASGISDPLIGYERDGTYTLRLVRESSGLAIAVSDEAIRAAMRDLAHSEGILAEPTAASSLAALKALVASGRVESHARVVCMVTGHGLKDVKVYKDMPGRIRHITDFEDREALASIMSEELGAGP